MLYYQRKGEIPNVFPEFSAITTRRLDSFSMSVRTGSGQVHAQALNQSEAGPKDLDQ